ncbi:camp-dependent protein kinase [Alternaria alternata]|jgi:hypothetical protein|nr:camp-dependent protein kinase [Alternaria alternata]
MADPLSIAGSVVGITAAGVQASVKLYALAEKVATASQRVTSIADDVSSTCAILNQVRELIIPQPDAQGTLKSVFNSTALEDISHGLQRCRSAFTEIEALLRRAFEQVGKRPALRSKIELSRFEKAKWPFLQPQFDELRNDLRDAKGNLILMIAVASLALAQRDGRQRPIHETERLELGSTIVQLQQARISKPSDQKSLVRSQEEKKGWQQLFDKPTTVVSVGDTRSGQSSTVSLDRGYSPVLPGSAAQHRAQWQAAVNAAEDAAMLSMVRGGSGYGAVGTVKSTQATPLSVRGNTKSTSLVSEGTSDPYPADAEMGCANVSLPSIGNAKMQEQWKSNMVNRSVEEANINLAILQHTTGSTACFGRQTGDFSGSIQESHAPEHKISRTPAPEMSGSNWGAVHQVYKEHPGATASTATSSALRASENTLYYCGWITRHLQGLTTGFGDSVSITQMNLPDQSLEKLVKNYADAGLDPHISLLDLTEQQQDMIKQAIKTNPGAEVAYISVSRDIKVSSVFGMLDISGLKWIAASRKPWLKLGSMAQISHVSPQPFLPARDGPPASLPEKPLLAPFAKTNAPLFATRRGSSVGHGHPPPRPYDSMSSSVNSRPHPPALSPEEQCTQGIRVSSVRHMIPLDENDRANQQVALLPNQSAQPYLDGPAMHQYIPPPPPQPSSTPAGHIALPPPPSRPTNYGNLGGIPIAPPIRPQYQQQGYDPGQYRNYPHNIPPPPGPPPQQIQHERKPPLTQPPVQFSTMEVNDEEDEDEFYEDMEDDSELALTLVPSQLQSQPELTYEEESDQKSDPYYTQKEVSVRQNLPYSPAQDSRHQREKRAPRAAALTPLKPASHVSPGFGHRRSSHPQRESQTLSETNTGYEDFSQYQQSRAPTGENGEDIVNELLARWTTLEHPAEESH